MEIKKFAGIKNTTSAERLEPGYLAVARNVDIDDAGRVLSRLGVTELQAGGYHSLWAGGGQAFVVSSTNDLCRVNADFSLTTLTRLSSARRVSYNLQGNTVYLSNGVDSLRVTPEGVRPWGTTPPSTPGVAAAGAGALPAGRYFYALTYLRGDGYESGASDTGQIELTARGGIALTGLPSSSDSDVVGKVLYLSTPNGAELFRAAVIPAAASQFAYLEGSMALGAPVDTLFDRPPPAGHIVEWHAGIMYVVRGNVAYASRPWRYESFDRLTQFLQFPGRVTMFAAVNDGIFVSAGERTWFLAGKDPASLDAREIFQHGAIEGTAARTEPGKLRSLEETKEGEQGGLAVMWTSPHGVCVGVDGGAAANLTERVVSFPGAQRGAGLVRQVRGYTQYLGVLEGTGVAANAAP